MGDFNSLHVTIYQKLVFNCLNPFTNISGYLDYLILPPPDFSDLHPPPPLVLRTQHFQGIVFI